MLLSGRSVIWTLQSDPGCATDLSARLGTRHRVLVQPTGFAVVDMGALLELVLSAKRCEGCGGRMRLPDRDVQLEDGTVQTELHCCHTHGMVTEIVMVCDRCIADNLSDPKAGVSSWVTGRRCTPGTWCYPILSAATACTGDH